MGIFLIGLSLAWNTQYYSLFQVDGDSMAPTLQPKEYFVLDKKSYLACGCDKTAEPKRGDIIVFVHGVTDYFYVKRVIGLPGELVKINSKGVFVKKVYEKEYTKLPEDYLKVKNPILGLERTFKVPYGKYFVLGDNRGASKDSRYFIDPYIAKEDILGKYISLHK